MTSATITRLARLTMGLLLGSLLVEGGLRSIEATPLWRVLPVADASLYGPDEATGYAHRPGARGLRTPENRVLVEISSLGLRDRLDRTVTKPAGGVRWAIAGDSIIEGQQVPLEQTFPYVAEERLGQMLGHKVEVVNLGLAGARPAVIVERLRSRAPALHVDGLIVMVSVGEFLNETPDDASAYAGYVAGPDGMATISHDFRKSRGFVFRSGPLGRAVYWATANSRLALLINNRRNAGLFAELAAAAPAPAVDACSGRPLAGVEALLGPAPPGFTSARLEAFIADLSTLQRQWNVPIVLSFRGLVSGCTALAAREALARTELSARTQSAGLRFHDLDEAVSRRLPAGVERQDLHGFGAKTGSGHLNAAGHAWYAEVVTELIADILAKGLPPKN